MFLVVITALVAIRPFEFSSPLSLGSGGLAKEVLHSCS